MTPVDRILLLATGLLAAYQVVSGIEGLAALPIICYTIAFGVLLIAGLLMIILGFEVLDSPLVVIVSTIIPLSLSAGLIAEYLPELTTEYLVFSIAGFLAVAITRLSSKKILTVGVLAFVHGVAGLLIFFLPLVLSIQGKAPSAFSLVGLGGALIGIGGLLLSFLKGGKPVLSRTTILTILPGLLLMMTIAFVLGFGAA